MKRFLLLSVVYTFFKVHGAANVTCASCSVEETTCNRTCTAETCVAIKELNTFQSVSGTYRGCDIQNNSCNPLAFTFTSVDGRQMRNSMACCKTDKCNEQLSLSDPPVSSVENGVHCVACEAFDTNECTGNKIACRGAENKCISFAGKSLENANETLAIKGCATESACSLVEGDPVAYGSKLYHLILQPSCTNQASFGAALSSVVLILPTVVPLMASILS